MHLASLTSMAFDPISIAKRSNHQTYKHTFLARVMVKIVYESNVDGKYKEFKDFFKDFSKLELSREKFDNLQLTPIRIKTEDGGLQFKIDHRFIQLKIEGSVYVDFKTSVSPLLDKVLAFLSNIGADVLSMEIRKINIWGVNAKNRDSIESDLMNAVLSPDLLHYWNPSEDYEDDQLIKLTRFDWSESNEAYTSHSIITFGFIDSENENEMSRLILDTVCETTHVGKSMKIAEEILTNINSRLYDMYHWAVSDATIKAMSE